MFTLWGRDQSPGLFSWQLCLPGWAVDAINLNKINKYSAQCYVSMPARSFKAGISHMDTSPWQHLLNFNFQLLFILHFHLKLQRYITIKGDNYSLCMEAYIEPQGYWVTRPPSSGNFNKCHKHTCIWAPGPGPPIKIQSCSLVSDWLGKKYGNW